MVEMLTVSDTVLVLVDVTVLVMGAYGTVAVVVVVRVKLAVPISLEQNDFAVAQPCSLETLIG